MYVDPGDGSGSFRPVQSDKLITFHLDGRITSNGDLCSFSQASQQGTSGTYSTRDSTFRSPDCHNAQLDYPFIYNSDSLIVIYPCIEACQAKYQKADL